VGQWEEFGINSKFFGGLSVEAIPVKKLTSSFNPYI
jgi:hypothetical protein